MKACSKCGINKDIEEYHKKRNGGNKRQSKCKSCRKQYYQDNKESISEYRKQYRQDNRDVLLEKSNQYYQINKEKIVEKRIRPHAYIYIHKNKPIYVGSTRFITRHNRHKNEKTSAVYKYCERNEIHYDDLKKIEIETDEEYLLLTEQYLIDIYGGVDNLENIRDAIGETNELYQEYIIFKKGGYLKI